MSVADVYHRQILRGIKTIEKVPELWREEVQKMLDADAAAAEAAAAEAEAEAAEA